MAYEPVSAFDASRFESPRLNRKRLHASCLTTVGNQPVAFTPCRVVGLTPVLVLLSTPLRVTDGDTENITSDRTLTGQKGSTEGAFVKANSGKSIACYKYNFFKGLLQSAHCQI